MQPSIPPLTSFSSDDGSNTDLSIDCFGMTSQQFNAIESPDDFDACPRVPHYWSPALRANPVCQQAFYSPIDSVPFSSQQLSSSLSPLLHCLMVNAPGGSYGETSMTSRRALPSDFVWFLPSNSGPVYWRLQYDVAQPRHLHPFTVWFFPFTLTTGLLPSVIPPWHPSYAHWLHFLHGNPPTNAVTNTDFSPLSPFSLYHNSQTSVWGIQLTPIGSGRSIEDSLHTLIMAITDGLSVGTGALMEPIIHYDPATSYLLPTSCTGSHRTAMGNHCVYVPREKAKQIADDGRAELFFFVKEYPTIDEGTSAFLKKLARAVRSHRILRVVIITTKTPSIDDLRRVNHLFGMVGFAYFQFFY